MCQSRAKAGSANRRTRKTAKLRNCRTAELFLLPAELVAKQFGNSALRQFGNGFNSAIRQSSPLGFRMSSELDAGHGALGGGIEFEELARLKAHRAGQHVGRKHLD